VITRRKRLNRLGALILLAGLLAAALIFATAADEDDALAYEIVDGVAYPVLASESKAYRHDLERFGGKSALFADDLRRGLAGLVQGKRLAGSVAGLALIAALACFAAARRAEPGNSRQDRQDESDARR
jgi:O-antigen ligase